MSEYVQVEIAAAYSAQARKVWFGALAVGAIWVAMILTPPIAEAMGLTTVSNAFYNGFSVICHQMPDRSFHLFEHKFGVCSRCFGVYFGIFAGFALYPLLRPVDVIDPFPRYWLFGAMVPIGIDWSLTIFGIWENTFTSRFVTGAILGIACAIFIVPALVEIFRLTTAPKQQKRSSK